jgi:hypothetical protein
MATSNFVVKGWPCNNPNGEEHMIEQVLTNGFGFLVSTAAIGVKTSNEQIEFVCDTGFGNILTNPLKTDNGQTVGERNRSYLHARLDAWLDKTFEENV